jgi:hypothetical protein
MKRGILGLGVCLTVVGGAGRALAAPDHSGFTGDLGIGIGITSQPVETFSICASSSGSCTFTSRVDKSTDVRVGLAPLSLSLGAFLTPKVALLFRASGTSFFQGNTQYVDTFYGAVVEVWPHDRFFVGGGPGVGYYGTNPLLSDYNDGQAAFALDARAGAALLQGRNHALTLSVEGSSGFYAEQTIFNGALIAAWKWY